MRTIALIVFAVVLILVIFPAVLFAAAPQVQIGT
jgi:hypothetical protein